MLDSNLIQRVPGPNAFRSRHVVGMGAIGRRALALADLDEIIAGAGLGAVEAHAA